MSTTITTHPINELQFPEVTVCPPRESNTLVNHPLRKVKTVNFTEDERKDLIEMSKQVFIKSPATNMTELLTTENIKSILNGNTQMPRIDDQGLITLWSNELEGSFRTPGFGSSDYKGDFYSRVQSLRYVVNPYTIGWRMTEQGALVITLQTEGSWSFMLQAVRMQWYGLYLNHSAAEEFCVKRGGHLSSVGSQEEQDMIRDEVVGILNLPDAWLGAKKSDDGSWFWLDGRTWQYQNWAISNPHDGPMQEVDVHFFEVRRVVCGTLTIVITMALSYVQLTNR